MQGAGPPRDCGIQFKKRKYPALLLECGAQRRVQPNVCASLTEYMKTAGHRRVKKIIVPVQGGYDHVCFHLSTKYIETQCGAVFPSKQSYYEVWCGILFCSCDQRRNTHQRQSRHRIFSVSVHFSSPPTGKRWPRGCAATDSCFPQPDRSHRGPLGCRRESGRGS